MKRYVIALCVAGCGRLAFDTDASSSGDAYATTVLADGPLAYWRLAETSGTVARDELGMYPGTYQGTCTLGASGALSSGNPAVQLDGASCRIVIGDVLEFAGATPFSIELWANLSVSDAAVRWLVSHNTSAGPKSGYSLAIVDTMLWFEQVDADTSLSYVATTLPALGSFHHVAVTTNAQRQRIYVDGAMVTEHGFTVSQPAGTGELVFGDYALSDPNKLAGSLDEIAVYGRELDGATIAAHVAAR